MAPEPPFGVRIGRLRSLRLRTMLVVVFVLLAPLFLALEVRWEQWQLTDLLKLTALSLPLVLGLGWWLGWRMVRPVEKLRAQVLEKLAQAHPRADLDLGRADEFGDLAQAFNALLARLEARSRAHEAFVADVAHELKNPVAAIRAAAESLATSDERGARLARVLEDSGRRLDDLLSQLLELARAEAGLLREDRVEIDLAALARGVASAFATDPRFGNTRFEVDAPPEARLSCVAGRIETALRNVVENAASFAGEGGWVRIAVTASPATLQIAVSDSGPGIRPEDLPRIFDRFFTTRGDRQGTGLGLAMVRAIVLAHRGSVSAESPAVIRIELPR